MKKNHTIWILEDDPGCTFVYQEILMVRYTVRFFTSFTELEAALKETATSRCELLIADIKLVDGILMDFLSKKKELFENLPFVVVSSLDDVDILRFTFEQGALDYLIKPFKKSELIVKIERIFRQMMDGLISSRGPIQFPQGLELTSKEEMILQRFFFNPQFLIDREQLEDELWPETAVSQKTLDVHIYNLRKKLKAAGLSILYIPPGKLALSRLDESPVLSLT